VGGEQLPQHQPEGILPLTAPVAAAELPRTGSNGVGGLVTGGLTLILLGLAALTIGRRRATRTV
jgi:LPXTG-motif cell wall-anchored protein